MKKMILLIMVVLMVFSPSFASNKIKNFVKYETLDRKTAKASLTAYCSGDVEILKTIKIGGNIYTVVEIGAPDFKKNRIIKSVSIPATVTKIGAYAFRGCTNLRKIVLPDGSYSVEQNSFQDCNNIVEVLGNTIPFINAVDEMRDKLLTHIEGRGKQPGFSVYAKEKLKERMELWQTKKEYETVEQYKARVTEEKRLQRMNDFKNELKEEYASIYAPKSISTQLGIYDSEYGVYTIRTNSYGNVYAKVPKADANNFRQNYNQVQTNPHFGVRGDTLAIISCDFILGNKIYASAKNYEGSDGLEYNFDLPPLDIDQAIAAEIKNKPVRKTIDRSIDQNIPLTKTDNSKTFVLIIGNEKYKRIAEVPFANNDAKVFAEYCQKTLGIPQKNIDVYKDASVGDMRHAVQVLTNRLKAFNGEARAIIYYSGHGYPDEATRMPYLMPIDGFASDISNTGYNLNDIYDELAEAPSQLTLFLLDACFSGTTRNGDMAVNAKGIAIAARNTVPMGNIMVFSASQGTETAYVDEEHGHGRFTYYLLKHLRESKGDTTLGSLVDEVTKGVNQASVIQNDGKTQTPTPNPSFKLGENWKGMKLR